MAQSVNCLLHQHEVLSLLLPPRKVGHGAIQDCKCSAKEEEIGRTLVFTGQSVWSNRWASGLVRDQFKSIKEDMQCWPEIHTHTHTHTQSHKHSHAHTYTLMFTCTHTLTHTNSHPRTFMCTHMHTLTYTFTHTLMLTFTRVHTHSHTHLCSSAHTHAHSLTCMHTHMLTAHMGVRAHTYLHQKEKKLKEVIYRCHNDSNQNLFNIPQQKVNFSVRNETRVTGIFNS